jgi:hypothetical protein
MSDIRSLRYALLGSLLPLAFAEPACAQSPLTYVSITGADSGSCDTAATACRTFAYAISQTDTGGEVKALTPGEFGSFTVRGSLTVTGMDGVTIGERRTGYAIEVSAGSGNVNLVGLTVHGLFSHAAGVSVSSAAHVLIKNCIIRKTRGPGIRISAGSNPTRYLIEDTTISEATTHGILVTGHTNIADGLINRVTVSGVWGAGVYVEKGSYANVTETVVTNSGAGFGVGADSWLEIARSTALNNGVAVTIDHARAAFTAGNNLFHHSGTIKGGRLTLIAPK